jgi:hypothetical protein
VTPAECGRSCLLDGESVASYPRWSQFYKPRGDWWDDRTPVWTDTYVHCNSPAKLPEFGFYQGLEQFFEDVCVYLDEDVGMPGTVVLDPSECDILKDDVIAESSGSVTPDIGCVLRHLNLHFP